MKQRKGTEGSKVNKKSPTKRMRKLGMTAKVFLLIAVISTLSALPVFALGWKKVISRNAWG